MATTNKKPKIVLVEDDQFIVDMYKIKLAPDFDLRVAVDGQDGLDLIRQFKPDLVLLDIILPRLDGFEVLEEIKKDPELKDIPVLLLTNLGQRDNIRRGLRLGALDYVIKAHYTPGEVAEKVKQVLEQISAKQ